MSLVIKPALFALKRFSLKEVFSLNNRKENITKSLECLYQISLTHYQTKSNETIKRLIVPVKYSVMLLFHKFCSTTCVSWKILKQFVRDFEDKLVL